MKSIGRRSTAPRGAIPALVVTAALSVVLSAAGCDDSSPDPATDPSSSATGSPTGSATTTESGDPTVTPASGVPIRIRKVSMNAPEGWVRTSDNFRGLGRGATDPHGSGQVGLYAVPSLNPDLSLDGLAKAAMRFSNYQGKPTVHDTVDVNGVECYHISGKYAGGQRQDQFGAIHADDQVSFTFNFDNTVSASERQDVIDSVLASVVWH